MHQQCYFMTAFHHTLGILYHISLQLFYYYPQYYLQWQASINWCYNPWYFNCFGLLNVSSYQPDDIYVLSIRVFNVSSLQCWTVICF